MSQSVTLGGDRLGSGKKERVHLEGFSRSSHNLSYVWRSSMSAGTLVPFMNLVALPGDTFDIDLDCDVKTLPTVGPLFGSAKVQLDVFVTPIRLYNSLLHNNKLNIGNSMSDVILPKYEISVPATTNVNGDFNQNQVNSSSLQAYIGVRGLGRTAAANYRKFNAVPLLNYFEIYKNYYSNKQEEEGAVIHTGGISDEENIEAVMWNTNDGGTEILQSPNNGTPYILAATSGCWEIFVYAGGTLEPQQISFYLVGYGWLRGDEVFEQGSWVNLGAYYGGIVKATYRGSFFQYWQYTYLLAGAGAIGTEEIRVARFPLSNIDDMREAILRQTGGEFVTNTVNKAPYTWFVGDDGYKNYNYYSQECLAVKTYQSDIFNNWLETTWVDNIKQQSAVSVIGGQFTIDQLILSRKVYDMLNRIAVSGGSYDDWVSAVYDVNAYKRAESPMYMGGLSKELVFQEVVSNTGTSENPLGTLAGKGVLTNKHKGGKVTIKCDEHCYIMGIVSITPRIDYSQGNDWDVNLQTMDDFHKPNLDQIGFQELITEQFAAWDTYWDGSNWVQKSAGKQPAWINYMTNYNKTFGSFANTEMFMTFNRRYERVNNEVKDLTTYIDPSKYNFIFASTALDSQNYWVQIAADVIARRKMSAKVMPNL